MMALIFVSIVGIAAQCCLNCATATPSGCSRCNAGYSLFNSMICLSQCPTGYTSNTTHCIDNMGSKTLVDFNFMDYTDINVRSAGLLKSYSNARFSSASHSTLMPTKDRGFYSLSNSALVFSTNWQPSPEITYMMWMLPSGSGYITEVWYSSIITIRIGVNSGYYLTLRGYNQGTSAQVTNTIAGNNKTSTWEYLKVHISQQALGINVQFWLNSVQISQTVSNQEFKHSYSSVFVVGGSSLGTSFSGFIYRLRIDQILTGDELAGISAPACAVSQYYDGAVCRSCTPSTEWPICTGLSSICDTCNYCSGYTTDDCSCEGSKCCHDSCLACTINIYTCTLCSDQYSMISNECASKAVIINQFFNGSFSGTYGNFRTGTSAALYYFMNTPEIYDPVPALGRGLYFSGGSYLIYTSSLTLGSDFTIGMWIKPYSGGLFYKGTEISYESYAVTLKYSNTYYTTSQKSSFSVWTYLSISVSSSSGLLLSVYYDNSLYTQNSLPISSFTDTSGSSLILGKTSSTTYTGFIYSFKLWSDSISSFSYEYLDEICGKSMSSGCLNECNFNTYIDRECLGCGISCGIGCVDSRPTCTICKSYLCQYCSDFNIDTCLQCISNASGQPCACNVGYYLYNYICNVCFTRCQSCTTSGYVCTSCKAPYISISGVCVDKCPTGFTLSSGACSVIQAAVVSLDFRYTLNMNSISGFTVGSNSSNLYPSLDVNDPWPAVQRGYYFSNGLYMQGSLDFAPFFSMNLWVKALTAGLIFSKSGAFSLSATAQNSYMMIVTMMQGSSLAVSFNVAANTWVYLSFALLPNLNTNTQLYYYVNTLQISNVLASTYLSDNTDNPLLISSSTSGFTGFIANIDVYTSNSYTGTTYLMACLTGCTYSLSNCEIYQDPLLNCADCPAQYTVGCAKNTNNACYDILCASCSDRNSASCLVCTSHATGSPCQCNTGYYQSGNQCAECFTRCELCASQGFLCLSCKIGFFLQESFCVENCTTGYTQTGQTCLAGSQVIIDLDLRSSLALGNFSGVSIGSNSSNVYPEFDSLDPWPSVSRGYYFSNGSYMAVQVVLAPAISVNVWVKVINSGVMFNKNASNSNLTISANSTCFQTNLTFLETELSKTTNVNTSNWIQYSLVLSPTKDQTTIQIYLNTILNSSLTSLSYYSDLNSSFYISHQNSTFSGFIWMLKLFNTNNTLFSLYLLPPLSNCSYLSYPPACATCPNNCTRGCDSGYCNLCSDKLCYTCDVYTNCVKCIGNSTKVNNACTCDAGFYNNGTTCEKCFGFCSKCITGEQNGCTECTQGLYLINGICSVCGIGYNLTEQVCKLTKELAFDLQFNNTLEGTIVDAVSQISVITGNSNQFYPDYESTDPYTAYLRGFYFNGNSSFLQISDIRFKIPNIFTFTAWINPSTPSGYLIRKDNFRLNLQNSAIYIYLNLTSSLIYSKCFSNTLLSNWSHISISINYTNPLTTVNCENLVSSKGYFLDNSSETYIGTDFSQYFKGFIYSIKFYTKSSIQRRLTPCLGSCAQCLDDGYCIPNCGINQFWVGPDYQDCENCIDICGFGCRSNKTCSLCADEKCNKCSTYSQDSRCSQCVVSSVLSSNCECVAGYFWDPFTISCYTCASNQFNKDYECNDCPVLCLTCSSLTNCTSCESHAELTNSICSCSIGYWGTVSCERNLLIITLTVSSDNQVLIMFSQDLNQSLETTDISVQANVSLIWYLEQWSPKQYRIAITYADTIQNGTELIIKFLSQDKLVSTTNGTPDSYTYTVGLSVTVDSAAAETSAAKKLGQAVTTAVTSAVTAASMMNPNPACLWSFINTVQMIVFISLAQVPIPPKSKGLIIGLKNYNFFPNIFEYFLPSGNPHHFSNAYDLGYASDSVVLNTGRAVTAFLAFMVLWVVLIALSQLIKKGVCTKKWYVDLIKELLADYKYGFFIRYGITNYIEFEIAALIGVINWRSVSIYAIINTILSGVILILIPLTPFLCFLMVIKRKSGGNHEEFDSLYGTLFYEFNNDKGVASSNFYVFFFLKRGVYGIILITLRDYGVVQMTVIITICFAYLLYLVYFKPFGEKILNYSNIFTELATLLIFGMITWLFFDLSETSLLHLDSAIYYSVYTIMGIQMASSIILLIKNLIDKRRNKKTVTKVVPINSQEAEEKNLNSVSLEISRIEQIDKMRKSHTASNLSKYSSFFQE